MMSLLDLTFLLAVAGYAGLAAAVVMAGAGRPPVRLWRATSVVIVLHVTLVWAVRYEWSLAEATRNGPAGFLIFHGALALIVVSHAVRPGVAGRLIAVAFAIVTLGALGAVFRYAEVAVYRIPVILIAAAGATGLLRQYVRRAGTAGRRRSP